MEKQKHFIEKSINLQLQQIDCEDIEFDGLLVEVNIARLIRPNYSSRALIDNQVVSLTNSLTRFGFLGGIFIERSTWHVIDGWHRVEEWKKLGQQTIPCYLLDCNQEQERRLHLSLNQQAATFSPEAFGLHFDDFDLIHDFGFTKDDIGLPDLITRPKFPQPQKEQPDGYHKLSTTLPVDTYRRLKALKNQLHCPNIAEVIIKLTDLFYESN